ncbi:MAG: DUF885 domain-containing protein, partial [Thermaurantiacus sp.]
MRVIPVVFLLLASAAHANPEQFDALLEDHWAWYLANNPVQATILGERAHDERLNDLSLAGMDRQAAEARALLARLDVIDRATLDNDRQVSADVLARLLRRQVEANGFPARARLFTNREGFHTVFGALPQRLPFFTAADYQSYIARLEAFPAQVDQAIETTRQTIRDGWTLPCEVLDGFEGSVRRVAEPIETSRFLAPFMQRPQTIPQAEWAAMGVRAERAVARGVNPAYTRFADFFAKEYLPACRKEVGVSALRGGRDFYAWRARQETTTDLTPDAIHEIGLSEVARIRAEMEDVAKRAGFDTREAYIAHLRTDPQYYATTPGELMREVALATRIADGWMPRLFGKLPRQPY